MRVASTCLMFVAAYAFWAPSSSAQQQNTAYELWRVRSQNITNDLLKDATDLSSMQRALLLGKLAQRWWREDPRRARIWITNAIEIVEQVPNKETPADRDERLRITGLLLTIVTPLEDKPAKRLLAVLTTKSKAGDNDRINNADALIDAAVSLVEEDPKRAAELGALALRNGRPQQISRLLFPLRAQDPKLADSLFVLALPLVKQEPGSMLANSLIHVAFPVQRGHSGDIPVPPEPLRVELLEIFVTRMNANPGNTQDPTGCGSVCWLAPLFSEFERLLPKQMPVVRQAINRCQSPSPQDQRRIEEYTRGQPLNTVDALLNAAADAKDAELRMDYEYRAANLANEAKDYERAIRILEDMSKEQRESEWWNLARWDWAADGAIEHYKHSHFREMNLMLEAVPSDLQPLAKAAFLDRLSERSGAETAPIIQILNDAIKGLRRSSLPARVKYNWYFALLRATVKYQFGEANEVLKDAVASLNQVDYATELDAYEPFRNVGVALAEMDEFIVKDALASVTIVPMRAQLRLSLLAATLQRMRNAPQN